MTTQWLVLDEQQGLSVKKPIKQSILTDLSNKNNEINLYAPNESNGINSPDLSKNKETDVYIENQKPNNSLISMLYLFFDKLDFFIILDFNDNDVSKKRNIDQLCDTIENEISRVKKMHRNGE